IVQESACLPNCIWVKTYFRLIYQKEMRSLVRILSLFLPFALFGQELQSRPQQRPSSATPLCFNRPHVAQFGAHQKLRSAFEEIQALVEFLLGACVKGNSVLGKYLLYHGGDAGFHFFDFGLCLLNDTFLEASYA